MSKHEAGYIEYRERGGDKVVRTMTYQCVHCGGHFTMKPPALLTKTLTPLEAAFRQQQGKQVRGFCTRCNGYFCGPHCQECVPEEQLLENLESGRRLDYRPIVG